MIADGSFRGAQVASRLLSTACGLTLIVLLTRMAANNLTNPNFSFDEAGQFWIAQGLFHYSPPLEPPGSFYDVLLQNARWNWDPGGFTVLLSLWTSVATTPVFLRLLPLLFFLVTVCAAGTLAYEYTHSTIVSLTAATIPLLFPFLVHHAFEVRAYSMEACGVFLSLVLLNSLSTSLASASIWRWTSFGLVVAIMMTSRYSFVVIAAVVSMRVIFLGTRLARKERLLRLAAFGVPLGLSLVVILWCGPDLLSQRASPLDYVEPFLLKGKSADRVLGILRINFLSPTGWRGRPAALRDFRLFHRVRVRSPRA